MRQPRGRFIVNLGWPGSVAESSPGTPAISADPVAARFMKVRRSVDVLLGLVTGQLSRKRKE